MEYLFLVMTLPVLWPFVAKLKWGREFSWSEMVLNVIIAGALTAGVYELGRYTQTADVELLNGEVLSKASEKVSCSHSYSCNCREVCSGSGQNRSCSTKCDTCYEHFYDVDWVLHSNVGNITIDRVDRQGVQEPARFSRARAGDPVARQHVFTNYIKGAPDSLFNTRKGSAMDTYLSQVPAYPMSVYDYHYVNRVLTVGVAVPELNAWNRDVADLLKKVGPSKEANIVILFAGNGDPMFAESVKKAWLGGKKNDVVVVMGTPSYPRIDWVQVLSWTDVELFKVQLRDELMDLKEVSRPAVMAVLDKQISGAFKRKSMKDFEYLKSEVQPPLWAVIMAVVLGLGASVLLSLYFTDHFGPRSYSRN